MKKLPLTLLVVCLAAPTLFAEDVALVSLRVAKEKYVRQFAI